MGEVYRAKDTRLDRIVAIKVLAQAVASDPGFRRRFDREAKAVAALSHPNICTLYDVGEASDATRPNADPVRFLVMEHLQGETLAAVLRSRRLPLDQALAIAIQIADALETAHRHGIVHRDLKPGNIIVTFSGAGATAVPHAKLLDFGLAKMYALGAATEAALAGTITAPLTVDGSILGTLHYMSPEQVEGGDADHRSDIFAFGAVLYEMATGERAFDGGSAASIIAAILERQPPAVSVSQPSSTFLLDHLVSRCLTKDRGERWQSAADVKRELAWIATGPVPSRAGGSSGKPVRRSSRIAFAVLNAILLAASVAALWIARRPLPSGTELRLEVTTPPTNDPVSFAISPDGREVVFVALTSGHSELWRRHLDSVSAQKIPGTEGAYLPFWSSDGRSVGFAASGQLKRIDLEGGSVRKLANAPLFLGGTWNSDGSILFVPNTNSPVMRIPEDGGDPVPVTPAVGQLSHHFPRMLPDGRHFLYFVAGGPEVRGVYFSQLDGGVPRRVLDVDAAAVYLDPGQLLFVRQGTLVAQPFDPRGGQTSGTVVPVVQGVTRVAFAGATMVAVSTSATGRILYRSGPSPAPKFRLAWFNRSGTLLDTVAPQLTVLLNPVLSHDERYVSMFTGRDISLMDLRSRISRPFTLELGGLNFAGQFSPDGRITVASNRSGTFDLYQKLVTGAGREEPLLATPHEKAPTDWSRDGKFLLYRSLDPKTSFDIWALSRDDRRTFPVVQTPNDERDAQFSPDGRWVAYESNATGRFEVWVRPFPGGDPQRESGWQVSAAGGGQVRWRSDGSELFFVGLDGRLMAASARPAADGQSIETGSPAPLLDLGPPLPFGGGTAMQRYMVSEDGTRILVSTIPVEPVADPLTLILDWARR